jgi:hypothetical protein
MRHAVWIAASLTVACGGGHFPRPPYSAQPTSALIELRDPMPPARVETVPAPPAKKTAVWIDGEWTPRRGRWAWMPGRWVDPPPGATFSPWVIVRGTDGRLWHAPGVWRDAKGAPIDDPPSLSVASVESQPVVSASGDIEVTGRTLKANTKAPAR